MKKRKTNKKRKCRMCGHLMSRHGINVAGGVYCQVDGCSWWQSCWRKEKHL